MKLNKKTGTVFFTLMALILVAGCTIGLLFSRNVFDTSLSETQIMELRETYPICGDVAKIPALVEKRDFTWAEIKKYNDTFIYATIDGEMMTFQRYVSTGDPELDKKRQENGIGDVYTFYEYPITVIEDTEGLYQPGDKLTMAANTIFLDYNPKLSKGMKMIIPAVPDSQKETRVQFGLKGMYYVTEDEHVLSAFDESTALMKEKLTGKKVDTLLRELKK